MSAKSAINKEVFIPHDEKMLAAVQVKRRTKKKIPFLATGGQGDYMTFICLSGQRTNENIFSSLLFSSLLFSSDLLVCVCKAFLCSSIWMCTCVGCDWKSHFNTSPLIVPLMFTLMSMFTFPLPIGWQSKSINCWASGQSFLNILDLH